MTKEQEIIWLAGLLEGEGCFSIKREANITRRLRLRVHLKMCDEDVVLRAVKVFPTKVAGYAPTGIDKQGRDRSRWNTCYLAAWTGEKAEEVMRAVLPYMGERRSAKIRECLSTPNLSHHPKERKVTS